MNEWLWTIVIVAVVLLLFGAKRIPEVMKSMGQGVKEFKKAAKEIQSDSLDTEPARPQQPQQPPAPTQVAQKPADSHLN
jgi:sec-independent protein translocase protein TatA